MWNRSLSLPIVLVVILCAAPSRASEEQFTSWSELTFTTAVPAPYGALTVHLAVDAAHARLAEVSVSGAVLRVTVPASAWAGVEQPRLAEVTTTFEVGYDPVPWFYVKIPYGAGVQTDKSWAFAKLVLAFQGTRIIYRALVTPKADGSYDWHRDDVPAK